MTHDERDVRHAAESIYQSMYRQYPPIDYSRSQSHSINFITEDFLAGYMQDGRMSVVRRFFCLFVTFDLVFISLLWLICILITGDNIYNALKTQILHYSIYTSLFDIVMAAVCRFTFLLLFYALLYINHWIIIALSTTGSCAFLISKVFVFNWVDSPQPVFQVLLIVTSFVLAWGEAWFLDCRVIPQEQHARNYVRAVTPHLVDDRTPLMAPFLSSQGNIPPESIGNFYSPYDSIHNSDSEEDQDEDYINMGKECVRKAHELLDSSEWKIEKVTTKGDTIRSTTRKDLGKIYRLTAKINFPAKSLLDHLFYKIEEIPKWNPTILESKIIRKIDTHTDISYQATAGAAGGLVKSRDFVNLRCWHLCRDGAIVTDDDDDDDHSSVTYGQKSESTSTLDDGGGGKRSVESESELMSKEFRLKKEQNERQQKMQKSLSDATIAESGRAPASMKTLSKSLGGKGFYNESTDDIQSGDDEKFEDATSTADSNPNRETGNVYVSSAVSVPYAKAAPTPKYIRGENLLSCWAMKEIEGKVDSCIFEWLLCIDLKGYFPRYVLDQAYTTLMQDYMVYLRKYCAEIQRKKNRSHHHHHS